MGTRIAYLGEMGAKDVYAFILDKGSYISLRIELGEEKILEVGVSQDAALEFIESISSAVRATLQ